jgi:hypothetical protein
MSEDSKAAVVTESYAAPELKPMGTVERETAGTKNSLNDNNSGGYINETNSP